MIRINVSKMEDIHKWIAELPPGTRVEAGAVAKRFNLSSAAVAGRMIASSDRPMRKERNGSYHMI